MIIVRAICAIAQIHSVESAYRRSCAVFWASQLKNMRSSAWLGRLEPLPAHFIDSVITTGTTVAACRRALGHGVGLGYADARTFYNTRILAALLNRTRVFFVNCGGGSRTSPFEPFLLLDTRLKNKKPKRAWRIGAMCEINFHCYIVVVVSAAFDPRLMGASKFFAKGKSVFPQEIRNVLVTPVAKSPRHNRQRYASETP